MKLEMKSEYKKAKFRPPKLDNIKYAFHQFLTIIRTTYYRYVKS